MPVYRYFAMNHAGKRIKSTIEAKTAEEAKQLIKGRGELPLEIKEENVLTKDIELPFLSKISPRTYSVFCWQLRSVLGAGVSIVPALEMMGQQTENKKLRTAIQRVKIDVEKGESFSDALGKQKDVFPPMLVNMIAAGEASGNLENSLERMAVHFEKDGNLKAIVKKAMIYPVILIFVIVVVMIIILTYVIPSFMESFEDLNIELPLLTRAVMALSDFVIDYWYVMLLAVILGVVGIVLFGKTDKGRHAYGWLGMKLPLFGALTVRSASAGFSRTLSTLLAAGLPVLDALEITARNMNNVYFCEASYAVREEAAKGIPMSQALEHCGIFPMMLCHMMGIGEETGEIEGMLEKVADYYDEEVENATRALTAAMEPMITIIMGIVVGTLVLAIVLPIMALYNGLDQFM